MGGPYQKTIKLLFVKVKKHCSLSYIYVLKSFPDFFFLLLLEVFFPKLVNQLSEVSPWSCKFC